MFNLLRRSSNRPAPIDPRDAVARVQAGTATLIDIRDPSECRAGVAAGALRIPMAAFRMKADPSSPECHPALATDKPVYVYCASGARSSMAAGMLRKMGYLEVHNLGGLFHWQQAGGAIER